MIEFLETHVPADGDELFAVMLGVALRALVVAPVLAHQRWVQPLVCGQPLLDFQMTGGALQLAIAAAADVTTGTVRRPVEFRVGLGQGAGGELSESDRRQETQPER
jgi:hypothetical protein